MIEVVVGLIICVGIFVCLLYVTDKFDEERAEAAEKLGLDFDAASETLVGVKRGVPVRLRQHLVRRRRGRLSKSQDWRTELTAEMNRHWGGGFEMEWRDPEGRTGQSTGGRVRTLGDETFDTSFAVYNQYTNAIRDALLSEEVQGRLYELSRIHDRLRKLEIENGKLTVHIRWELDYQDEVPELVEAAVDTVATMNEVIERFDPGGSGAQRADEYAERDYYGDFM